MIKTDPKYYTSENILFTWEELNEKLKEHRLAGKKIGMCTGSFDLLHPGHITHLVSAKKFCDILFAVVAIDNYNIRKTNKKGRPVFNEQVRAFCISQLKPVDYVIFNDGNDTDVIELIRPDVYIKGADYLNSTNPELEKVKIKLKEFGAKIFITEDEKLSTTELIRYITEDIE